MSAIPLLRADFGPPPPEPAQPPSEALGGEASVMTGLSGYIKSCFEAARQHRKNLGIDNTMLEAMRAMRGEYDAETLRDIKQFGGSEIYARITASKVRGTSAMLREIYTATERPWALSPTPEPALSGPSLTDAVAATLQAETAEVLAAGGQPTEEMLAARLSQLREMIQQQRKKVATTSLHVREQMLDDLLWEGGFYNALWEALGDLATFPFACVKGPVVRNKNVLKWEGRKPVSVRTPVPQWERCSPFDVFFAPWSNRPHDGYIIHRERVSRSSIQSLIGLQSYDSEAIQRVLDNWEYSSTQWYDYDETERADLEQRESQTNNIYSHGAADRPMPMLSFYGRVSADLLKEWGMKEDLLPPATQDLSVFVYMMGSEVIGVTVNPHPEGKAPFYIDSFERVPGSVYGNAIPALINDVQAVGNAALRAMVNNLAIGSGPMGWVNEERLASNDPDSTKLWPWKMFRFTSPLVQGTTEEPMKFFQPDTNTQELFNVYQAMLNMADEITTMPRYMQGNGQGIGGAGRTAAGLSMLMEAANRTIKQTVSSIDSNMIEPAIEDLNIYLALTRTDVVVDGDISVVARGAAELMQREVMRMRRLEFLNISNNPIDQQLVGLEGRYHLLKEIARDLNMPLSDTLPMDEGTVKMMQDMMLQQAMGQMAGNPTQPANGTPPKVNDAGTAPSQGVARPQANNPGT